MILILSIEQDESTIDVIKWLKKFEADYVLLNNNDFIEEIDVDINKSCFTLGFTNKVINSEEISTVWYRRGNFFIEDSLTGDDEVYKSVTKFIINEKRTLFEYLHFLLNKKYCVNNYNISNVNK